MKLQRMHSTSFDWQTWRAGSIAYLGIPCRKEAIIQSHRILQKYAIGYIAGEECVCRPKVKHTAVMFLKNNEIFWFHLRNDEFEAVFGKQ